MKKKKLVIGLFILFICLLSLTIYTSFSSNIDEQEIVIKNMVPVYDETSTIEVDNNNVVFNDKNQVVKYNVVLENTEDYDVKISDIKLSTPTEEFLDYKVEGIGKDDVLNANSAKELTISFETMGIKGWGRNFNDELTANISFEKVVKQEEVIPPVEEEKQPEAPATNTEELISKTEKIEIIRVTKDTIEFKETNKLETGDKIAVWLYSEPIFLGYFDVVEKDGIKQIVGLEQALKKVAPEIGNHNLALVSEDQETIGYVSVYINENKELLMEKPQDSTSNEETPKEEDKTTEEESKQETDNKDESTKDEEEKIENPYTSDKKLVGILGIATCITGVAIIIVSKNKLTKYTVFILMLSPAFTITNAEEVIEVAIKNNVSFESQNVMQSTGCTGLYTGDCKSIWHHNVEIKNIYIQNEITEIKDFDIAYDISEQQNGRVMAYLVTTSTYETCFWPGSGENMCQYRDLYIQADGIIYANENASYYFANMNVLDSLNNLAGIDMSKVTDMSYMFSGTSSLLNLDVSNFDTSNVTNMRNMFSGTGYNSTEFTLDVSNFDTSRVTDMSYMFSSTGYSSSNFTLDVSKFDTSKVTDMNHMFSGTGYSSSNFTLDVSNFDTSKVTDMSYMFNNTGNASTKFNTQITIRNPDIAEREVCEDDGGVPYCYTWSGYRQIFTGLAVRPGTKMIVNYTAETKDLIDKMLATAVDYCVGEEVEVWNEEKGDYEIICDEIISPNVVKGELVE